MFAIARFTSLPDLFWDSSNPYYLIDEYHEDHSMKKMDDPQDFFDKVDYPREPGITWTPLRVAPEFPSPFWPKFYGPRRRRGLEDEK